MRTHTAAGFIFLVTVTFCAQSATAQTADVNQLLSSDPMTWLVKSVCVDAQSYPIAVDPYGGCPAGAGIRKIAVGDPLPYHNIEQFGYQQRDAFPISNPRDGKTWIINTYDYRGYQDNIIGAPRSFDSFNLYATEDGQSDGYDVIALQDNVVTAQDRWATIVNTQDGGGYQQMFYGSNCRVGDGWVLFPANGFLSGGQAKVTIADRYWEQSDQNYPGNCPTGYSTPPLTSWEHQTGFNFGGVNGNPTKVMDTLISYHGFKSSTSILEVFYFTREYGMTRWEVWVPKLANPTATTTPECITPATPSYQGVLYVITNCHDWSELNSPLPSQAEVPVWPIPNVNLLSNPHFIGTTSPWRKLGTITATPMLSQTYRDTLATGLGVGYLRLGCGSRCTNNLTVGLYQDMPASEFVTSGNYAFGINVRTDPNQCPPPCSGKIAVAMQQFDARNKKLLSTTLATATVVSDNGTPDPSDDEANSVYLSTAFVFSAMTRNPNAGTVRFLISPQSGQMFDVLNAWLAAWPAPVSAPTQILNATTDAPASKAAPEAPPVPESPLFSHPSEESVSGSKRR